MLNKKHQKSIDNTTFLDIRKWYLFALAGIALTLIIAQLFIQVHLSTQLNDAHIINVAGRQRAFSQKLVKEVLLLKEITASKTKQQIVSEIVQTLLVWKTSHIELQKDNLKLSFPAEENTEVVSLFQNIDQHHKAMVIAVEEIISQEKNGPANFQKQTAVLLNNERDFLRLMNNLVNSYEQRSAQKLQKLKQKEYLLFAFSLLIILLVLLFIFRPLSIQIKNTLSNLIRNQSESNSNIEKIKVLLTEKETTLQELQELNFVIDNAALFASTRKDGNIVFISKKFLTLLGIKETQLNKPLSDLLTADEGQQQYLKQVLKSNRKNSIRNEEIRITTTSDEHIWLDMSIIPMHQASEKQSILILCSDITQRKENLLKVEQLTQQNFDERMLQKKIQASQIVEGQEEERKRIAKDIHDGIGQMLTALKFNIESIDLSNIDKSAEKINYLKTLTSDLIKGVRTATFNLTPPELTDHGIFPALHKMTVELSKLTGKTILFENKSEENIRFDSLAETNIYRVTQEAVNNAIKYANASYILVTINFVNNILSVVIDDDGKGFDPSILKETPKNNSEGGMGLFFMRERMSYINGRLFIHSEIDQGTRVTVNYKTDKEKISDGTE